MSIWLLALVLTAIACATLYYAGAGRTVNAGVSTAEATTAHFRAQLEAIEVDAVAGRMGPAEATAAKGELAREVMRLKRAGTARAATTGGRAVVILPVALVAVLALGTYWFLGRPDLPAQPLAERSSEGAGLDLDTALKTIEARLAQNPDDIRGWQVIAPAYMQMGRYADAVNALRHVNQLQAPTAESDTQLGEALMMANSGSVAGEPLDLFRQALGLDPKATRARYYLAGEETRTGSYQQAIDDWNALLALGKGDEPWVETARNGLAFAEEGLHPGSTPSVSAPPSVAPSAPMAPPTAPPTAPSMAGVPDSDAINAMVDGLETRLKAGGGSIDEWTQLVRSRMVQDRMTDAQADFDLARKAYPDPEQRTDLDVLAADNGLTEK